MGLGIFNTVDELLDIETSFKITGGHGRYLLKKYAIQIPKEDLVLDVTNCRPWKGASDYYFQEASEKEQIVLHFTGATLPEDIPKLSKSADHSAAFVLARDGTIYQLFNSAFWARHLDPGTIDNADEINKQSIAIQISNVGLLSLEGETLYGADGFPYCYKDEKAYYEELAVPIEGKQYFASCTNDQYNSLILLLRYLTNEHNIPREVLDQDSTDENWGDTRKEISNYKGILFGVNFIKDPYGIGAAFNWKRVKEDIKSIKIKIEKDQKTDPTGLTIFDLLSNLEQPETTQKQTVDTISFLGANKNYELGGFERKRNTGIQIPTYRRLRGYAFDPSLSFDLETSFINEIVFQINWEGFDVAPLGPGPRGEYLEVIDYDPASKCYYEPVDLNTPYILASDGLAPAEGNPQFHQQMVYAVGMTTIQNFERALGRWAIWSPRLVKTKHGESKKLFVKRLRIYPHALREANAYYSSDKKALLFGYFPADPSSLDIHIPGGTVFTCLSHDVIAHETAHALLDGMYQGLIEPVHPDNLAFHEAFSDIVALFQHFTFSEVLQHQIAKTRGDLSSESLLGQLAQQVGLAIGNYGALRSAIGSKDPETGVWEFKKADPNEYLNTHEPHDRGAILVGAVFDAFLAIYNKRIADYKRIASEGTGILRAGDLHPDLVNRLAKEASKAAQHVLNICIRALDYCPPNEISFGDYLRALITADYDLVPEDSWGYRVAFIEAFKRRGIYPRDVRSLSVDSLRWKMPHELSFSDTSRAGQGEAFQKIIKDLQPTILQGALATSREEVFEFNQKLARELKGKINEELREDPWFTKEVTGLDLSPRTTEQIDQTTQIKGPHLLYDKEGFGLIEFKNALLPDFEVTAVRLSSRNGPQGNSLDQLIFHLSQERRSVFKDKLNQKEDSDDQNKDDLDQNEDADNQIDRDPDKNIDSEEQNNDEADLPFRGGATLIVDWKNQRLKYAIKRKINDEVRLEEQKKYLDRLSGFSLKKTYFRKLHPKEPFMALHTKIDY